MLYNDPLCTRPHKRRTHDLTRNRSGISVLRNERATVWSSLGMLRRLTVGTVPRYVITAAYVLSLLAFTGSYRCVSVYELLAMKEQSCAQGFQPWETVNDTGRTSRGRQFIFPSFNFSCDGVITGWTLKRYDREDDTRPDRGRILEGEFIALQLWRQKTETESLYTLQTEQTHTARTGNAPSYSFTASSSVTVTAGDVFGFYIPTGSGTGLRVATAVVPEYTVFIQTATPGPTEFTVTRAGFNQFPFISIDFSKSSQHCMIVRIRVSE